MKKIILFAFISSLSLSLVACQPVEDFKRGFNEGLQEEIAKKKLEEADKILAEEAEKLGDPSNLESNSSTNISTSSDLFSEDDASFDQISAEQELIDVMYDSLATLQDEDVYGYMAYLSLSPENYQYNLEFNQKLAEIYDLSYVLEDIEVLEVNPTTAKVKVTQTTTKIDGPEFDDNRSTFIHNMVLKDGEWKFESTEILSTEKM